MSVEYRKLMAVTGMPGLYEVIGNKKDGAILRNLEEKALRFVSSRLNTFSHLETIEIFTIRENVNLIEIFHAMANSTEALPSEKDSKALKAYFEKVYPDLDFDRVYVSDMKKMVKWFSVIKSNQIELKLGFAANEELKGEDDNEIEIKEAETTDANEKKVSEDSSVE